MLPVTPHRVSVLRSVRLETGGRGGSAYDVFVDCFEKGLLIRVTGDIIAFSPPLIAEEKHFGEIVSILGDALKRAK